ncbi:AfsR/SARP family transcriptional regulator [Allonocardiopsis opalescens]|uniref:AfsR/SARP family transcriptional regulator n=1 Tax=Allonocardiopsis opalescens TaxID=1144618 RepID=UPI001B800049|nr:AfsR/SARP family transcriptional regulator [Allonocardiopsis opalescens]
MLGPLEIVTDGHGTLSVTAAKSGRVLALLLVRRHEIVAVDTLIGELWGDRPPRSALTTLQTYVYHARQMFVRELGVPLIRDLLVTRPPGYLLRVADEQVDAREFELLVDRGRAELEGGRPAAALDSLRRALRLWRGAPFCSVETGEVLSAHATRLEELRLGAVHLRIEAEMRLGRYRDLVPDLHQLVRAHPLDEALHARLIEALYRTGRRADALAAYQRLWRLLDAELGVEPGPELRALQQKVLGAAVRPPRQRTGPAAPRPEALRARAAVPAVL